MRSAMLFAAGLFAGLAVHVAMAQNASGGVVMMNHVGINVPNIPEAVTYYTQKMGYREAFRLNDEKGQARIIYLHISRNTFLELNQASAPLRGVAASNQAFDHRINARGNLRGAEPQIARPHHLALADRNAANDLGEYLTRHLQKR